MQSGMKKEQADMKCIYKTAFRHRTSGILRDNEGASLVLVTIMSIIIVTSIVILTTNVNTLITSADRQYYQDQAYIAASSMGSSVDALINTLSLETYEDIDKGVLLIRDDNAGYNIKVEAWVIRSSAETFVVTVTAQASGETYIYTATYCGSNKNYMRVS